mmetsp:Transcript_10988/g.30822  ORF Transcript_10988/g.30822 Transcript_10988/m.30822 type:complete len:235 (+) Transcript_10988:1206-1910(+)
MNIGFDSLADEAKGLVQRYEKTLLSGSSYEKTLLSGSICVRSGIVASPLLNRLSNIAIFVLVGIAVLARICPTGTNLVAAGEGATAKVRVLSNSLRESLTPMGISSQEKTDQIELASSLKDTPAKNKFLRHRPCTSGTLATIRLQVFDAASNRDRDAASKKRTSLLSNSRGMSTIRSIGDASAISASSSICKTNRSTAKASTLFCHSRHFLLCFFSLGASQSDIRSSNVTKESV